MLVQTSFSFLVLFFGFVFEFRILKNNWSNKLKLVVSLTNFGTIVLLLKLLKVHLIASTLLKFVFLLFVLLALFFMCQKTDTWIRKQKLKRDLMNFLSEIILRMQSGNAFRTSFLKTIDEQNPKFQKFWRQIYENVTFSQQFNEHFPENFENKVLKEFIHINQSPENALKLIKNYRYRLNLMQNFRRRSGAISQQIKAQALVLSFLYAGLFVFSLNMLPFVEGLPMYLASLSLFFLGLILTFTIGRSLRWKL